MARQQHLARRVSVDVGAVVMLAQIHVHTLRPRTILRPHGGLKKGGDTSTKRSRLWCCPCSSIDSKVCGDVRNCVPIERRHAWR